MEIIFGIRKTQYNAALAVNKQTSVCNTTYAIQSRVNFLIFFYVLKMLCWFRAIELFECQKSTFGIRNIRHSRVLIPSVCNTTYTMQILITLCDKIKKKLNTPGQSHRVGCEFYWVDVENIFFIFLEPTKICLFDKNCFFFYFAHKFLDFSNISDPVFKA